MTQQILFILHFCLVKKKGKYNIKPLTIVEVERVIISDYYT